MNREEAEIREKINMTEMKNNSIETGLEIAVIGMAGMFPGAGNLEQFWENLKNGVEAISFFSTGELQECGTNDALLEQSDYIKAYNVISGREYFDAPFFGYSPREAETLDPLTRLLHECSWEALEDAGYDPMSFQGAIGMYAGASDGFGWQVALRLRGLLDESEDAGGHMTDSSLLLSTRVSHKLNLRGPSIMMFTACSTGLVTIHTACRALLTGECEMALAGAGSVLSSGKTGYLYREGMILSPDGHCRPFDERAGGTVFGEGVGVVLLKRLKAAAADGDTVKCIIKASAVNNDGIGKASFTAPGKKRIADVIRTVLKLARVEPGDIGYLEAHGTATSLGDAIELEALKEAFAAGKKGRCGIGSLKSNIGHLDVAAGIAGFIKTVLVLKHRLIPPTLHFERPNPKMDFIDSPFYVNTVLSSWGEKNRSGAGGFPLRAGVCSFGIGGTNAFVLVEEPLPAPPPAVENKVPQLLLLSARGEWALEKMTANLVEYFKNNPGVNLADAAYTLQVGRRPFSHRRMLVCSEIDEAVQALSSPGDNRVQTSVLKGKTRDLTAMPAGERGEILKKIGMAWLKGTQIDWREFYGKYPGEPGRGRFRIPLPTYPFEGQRYWIDADFREFSFPGPGVRMERINNRGEMEPEAVVLYPRPALSTEYAAPADEIERSLVGVWQKFFGIREVGIYDDFFELGGDSLKAITVVLEIHKRMDTRVPITEIFQSPTIKELAEYIKGSETDKYSAIEPGEQKEYYPLSSVQKRIYILQQIEMGGTGYNNPLIFDMEGQLDKGRLENVFNTLVSRHESLRTSFELLEGETVQRIHREIGFAVEYIDLTTGIENYKLQNTNYKQITNYKFQITNNESDDGCSVTGAGENKNHRLSVIIHHFVRSFDLSRAPLLRVGLVRVTEENHILMTDMHHIVTDGSSIGILIREFMTLYSGETLLPLRIQYKDYTQWQNGDKQRGAVKKQEAYWLRVFAGEIPVINLPIDYARPAIQGFAGRSEDFVIDGEETAALKTVALNGDATLFMVLLAIYNIMLAKIGGQEDIVVGTPVAARTHADLQPVIGMLVNTLALRNYPRAGKTFTGFLKEVRENTLAAFAHQDYLFEDLVEQVTEGAKVKRDVSRNPVFDVMFNLLNIRSQFEANLAVKSTGLNLKPRRLEREISVFDLVFQGSEEQAGLTFTVDFCTRLFKPGTIGRFIGYFKKIVSTVTACPGIGISEIEIISAEEKRQILYEFNGADTADVPGTGHLIPTLFEAQVEQKPDNTALVFAGSHLTYKELNKRSGQLARLLRLKGVGPDVVVGVMIGRSIEMVLGILAVIKAGGAYLPLDPEYPQKRIDYMLTDSGAGVLLKKSEIRILKHETNPDDRNSNDQNEVTTSIVSDLLSSNLVYVIYTSGSTGVPKGVMLEHRGLANLILYQYRYTGIDFSRVLQFTTISFDVSFQEIFSTLLAGGTLFLVSPGTVENIPGLFDFIEKSQIKTLFLPASFLKFVFNEGEYVSLFPGSIGHIAAAGEQLIITRRTGEYLKANHVYLHNHYGPAETHVVTALTIDPASEIPVLPSIGRPLVNTGIYIVDHGMHLQPVGIAGELVIGGVQVGRGYLNRPELTNEKFCGGPGGGFSKEPPGRRRQKLYKTGDLARWLPDGNIEFLGRIDHMVKIRGFRIEPGEIERRLLDMDEIKEAVVVAFDDRRGEKHLCAYVVPGGGAGNRRENRVEVAALRSSLSKVLPDYMLPSYITVVAEIPLTPAGKVNRDALPGPRRDDVGERAAPGSMVEMELTRLWAEVLGMEKDLIGVDADFFELGGHSLRAAVLTTKIHKRFNVEVKLGEIFRQPTVRALAGYIKEAEEKRYMDIKAVEMKDYYPLSSAQKRLHFLQQLDLENTAYNMADVLKLDGGVDKDKLEETFREMIRRHESYRTSFIIVDEEPVQRIHDRITFEIDYYDLTAVDKGEEGGDHDSSSIIHGFVRAFDLAKAPLLRAGLVKLPENKHLVMVDLHHIISDGVSNRLFVREFVRLYFGEVLPGLRVQYKDYAVWQTDEALRWMRESRKEYWLREFPGEVPVLDFPYDYPRPAVQSFAGSSFVFEIGKEETAALSRLAQEHGVTLFMVLIAGFNILLSRFSGQQDIVIGTPTAGRGHTDLENIMGMFVNTLALRNFPGADKTFKEFLSEVKTRTLQAFENQDYQFENLVEQVAVKRDIGRSPLFDIMFAFQNLEERVEMAPAGREGFMFEYRFEKWVSRFDMTWSVIEKVSWLSIEVEYCTRLFKRETIERAAVCFKNVLAGAAASPGTRTADIEIIPAEEKQRILVEFNDTGREYPMDKTIHGLFVEQAEKTPEKMALVGSWRSAVGKGEGIGETGQLTYGELNKRSDQVAGLLRERGVHNDIIVGIMLERSLEMVIGILGILKAGGAYLPIAPEYPRQRIDYMLKDSNAMILLSEVSEVSEVSGVSEVSEKFPAQLCYVIYTSGSTGKPKGVMVEHRSVINRLNWMQRAYPIGEADRILQKTPTVFDVSVWELFWWSFQGASLSLPGHGDEKSPEAIVEAIRRQGVTTMHFVPSMLAVFLDYVEEYGDTGALRSLRQVFASGEALGSHQVKRFNRLLYTANNTRLINLYGPTEATVDVSFFNCDLNGDRIPERIPIGKPIDNIQLIVLDRYLQLLPIGIPGELCIGGDGVARGYVNRPELTAEKFVDYRSYRTYRTYIPRKVYKTGDLVRWLPDGNLEFLGRMDRQVKIRGYRIELGEIENRLSMYPGIKEALVMTKETDGGDKFLCAYIVPGEEDVLTGELKEYLSRALPAYMVPSYFVLLKAMPLTPNGKVDRNALPEPTAGYRSKYAAPADELEETLAEICTGLLGVNIGSDDNIFELGGHSLKIMTLISRIHKELDVKIPLVEVFQHQTTAKLAQYIRNTSMPMDRYSPIPNAEEREYYALSAAQKRLFIIQQMELESTQYNMLFMFPIGNKDEGIKKERLEKISRKLIGRHESLRTSFRMVDDEPVQQVHDEVEFETGYYDLAAENAKGRERIIKNFVRPFDLAKAPLLRVGLIETGDGDYLLVIDMHHIISDGISRGILEREFSALYGGEELPPLHFQYKDYSEWQNSRRQQGMRRIQEKYWLKRFSGELPVLNLPADYPRPLVRDYGGRQLGFFIGKEITGGLKELCRETGATLYMVLLTAFNVLLSRLSGQEDIIVGTPAAGRRHADLQDIIGMFVNTLSMRNFPAEEKRFSDFLREVKERTLEVYENQEYQFEDLVDKVSVKRDTARNPIFDVMIAFLDRSEFRVDIRGTDFDTDTVSDRGESKANFDITFEGMEVDDVIYFTVDYNTAIYRLETIKRFIIYFKRILAEIKDDPSRRLSSINLISEAEKNRVLVDFNRTAVEYAGEKIIHELFVQQAARTPDSAAAVGKAGGIGETGQLTYGELNKRSDQVARVLREKGVHNDIIVGIMVERSLEMIIGILGILKSGGAYLPIAPEYPRERVDYMLKDSGAKLLVTTDDISSSAFSASSAVKSLLPATGNRQPAAFLAYVIYTSGSTGRPKGVMVEHGNLSAYVGAFSRQFAITADDTVMQQASFTFDVFVEEVYPILLKGGRIAIAPGDELLDINLLSKFITGNRISVISFSPPLLSHLNQCGDLDRVCRYIHTVISGGDVLKQEYINELLKVGRVYNTYGPTETTVCATYYECLSGGGSSIPIGKPIAGYNVYILDKNHNLLPIGIAGELCVAGAGVTRGYLNRPELTAEKFILAPASSSSSSSSWGLRLAACGCKLYRTGDLARWLPDGNLEFLGRMDQQVKIRGYRIELGEIESQLLKIKGIKEAVVLVREDNTLQNSLCAYIVPEPGTNMESREIKSTLARVFPAYMIPDYLMPVEQIPLTPNGKIDRRALSAPGVPGTDKVTAPGNDLEEKVIEIWAEILGIEKEAIGMTDNFFELGGHSLKLTKLIIRIHKVFNVGIPVGELFKKPTVEGVCSLISVAEWAREQDREPEAGSKNEEVVL